MLCLNFLIKFFLIAQKNIFQSLDSKYELITKLFLKNNEKFNEILR